MNINQLYGGDYLKAADLQGQTRTLTIAGETVKEFDDGKSKLVLSFEKTTKTLVVNSTNANMIADAYGFDSAAWVGKSIELRPERVNFAGKMVDAIRVYPPGAGTAPAQAAAGQQFQAPPVQAAPAAQLDDDLPF